MRLEGEPITTYQILADEAQLWVCVEVPRLKGRRLRMMIVLERRRRRRRRLLRCRMQMREERRRNYRVHVGGLEKEEQ